MTALIHILRVCIAKKAFWCCLTVAFVIGLLLYSRSWREAACMAVILMISLFSVFEECQPDSELRQGER